MPSPSSSRPRRPRSQSVRHVRGEEEEDSDDPALPVLTAGGQGDCLLLNKVHIMIAPCPWR